MLDSSTLKTMPVSSRPRQWVQSPLTDLQDPNFPILYYFPFIPKIPYSSVWNPCPLPQRGMLLPTGCPYCPSHQILSLLYLSPSHPSNLPGWLQSSVPPVHISPQVSLSLSSYWVFAVQREAQAMATAGWRWLIDPYKPQVDQVLHCLLCAWQST